MTTTQDPSRNFAAAMQRAYIGQARRTPTVATIALTGSADNTVIMPVGHTWGLGLDDTISFDPERCPHCWQTGATFYLDRAADTYVCGECHESVDIENVEISHPDLAFELVNPSDIDPAHLSANPLYL